MGNRIEVTLPELTGLLKRVESRILQDNDWPIVGAVLGNLHDKTLRRIENLSNKLKNHGDKTPEVNSEVIDSSSDDKEEKSSSPYKNENIAPKKSGHGRNGAADYVSAQVKRYSIEGFFSGMLCPGCFNGRIYLDRPKVFVRIHGEMPFQPVVHELDQARCRLCGHTMTATCPEKLLTHHFSGFDFSAVAILIIFHYGSGLPFKRLESLHAHTEMPLPDATQWDVTDQCDDAFYPLTTHFENVAANLGTNLRIDDTSARVVEIQKEIDKDIEETKRDGKDTDSIRRGINTTALYFECPEGPIVLYYTGRHHAGEITNAILPKRKTGVPLIKVSDGAAKNFDHDQKKSVVETVCNTHSLRKFKDQKDNFPAEAKYVREIYKEVYKNDRYAKDNDLTPEERLVYHQERSGPIMDDLGKWVKAKLDNHEVEPNSGLWEPIGFISNQWRRLTEFLRTPGVPLDTNLVEQMIKVIIRYRNNSRVYKTRNGAEVGDRMMSLIATACANDINPVCYIEWCLDNKEDMKKNPDKYLPRVYRKMIENKNAPAKN